MKHGCYRKVHFLVQQESREFGRGQNWVFIRRRYGGASVRGVRHSDGEVSGYVDK